MAKGKVLVIGSNATRIEVQGGRTGPTGNYLSGCTDRCNDSLLPY
jgi:hypothetical protein